MTPLGLALIGFALWACYRYLSSDWPGGPLDALSEGDDIALEDGLQDSLEEDPIDPESIDVDAMLTEQIYSKAREKGIDVDD